MSREKRTRQIQKTICFLFEGETDEYYIKNHLKKFNLNIKYNFKSTLKGGGYKDFENYIHKNKSTLDIVFVFTDLDKANDLSKATEKENLKKLIRLLETENIKNNIFLNYKDIETWLSSSFDSSIKDIYKHINSKKGQEEIYNKIEKKNGNFDKAKLKFKESDLYYLKNDFKKGKIVEENLSKRQSNFIYLEEYLEKIDKT